jgi:hypothetical protein
MGRVRTGGALALICATALGGCAQRSGGTQIVLLGESFASGSEAVNEVNTAIANAAAAGCEAISVGGYGAAGEGLVIGVPVLVDCPRGTTLLPNGARAP